MPNKLKQDCKQIRLEIKRPISPISRNRVVRNLHAVYSRPIRVRGLSHLAPPQGPEPVYSQDTQRARLRGATGVPSRRAKTVTKQHWAAVPTLE